ncbi:MAG: translocation/assembly module TamB domain-containing protein [Bacteroidales bacterium]
MNKWKYGSLVSVFKKTFKIIAWVIVSFMLLFVVIAMLIQIPAIQTKIVQTATSYISDKTHTKIAIKKISISFPKSVVVQGLYLEDIANDTLIYAGNIKININFNDLFRSKIHIKSVLLEDIKLNLNRPVTDSLFNYNFLITAFTDTTSKISKDETKSTSKWTISIDDIELKKIQFQYIDNFTGTSFIANLKQLKLKINQNDLKQSIYNIDDLFVESLKANFLIKKSTKSQEDESKSILPKITATKLQINNTDFSFIDSVNKKSMHAVIKLFKINDASIDMQQQNLSLKSIYLTKSDIHYDAYEIKSLSDSTKLVKNIPDTKNNWKVTVKNIDLKENSVTYNVVNKPYIKNAFDVNHLDYKQLSLNATNLFYSSLKTTVSVNKFTTIDNNYFSISRFETDFAMDQHSIVARNLIIQTNNSKIDADINLGYSSLQSLKDSLPFLMLNLNLRNISVQNSNILYFSPQLIKQAFFKNKMNITTASGILRGRVNNLKGENLKIFTGVNTILETDFMIKGLPAFKTAYIDFPKLNISSGKQDITMIAGASIPKSLELPEEIKLHIAFKGEMKSFVTEIEMISSFGSAKLIANIDSNENFNGNLNTTDFNLGSLLKNNLMYGPVSLTISTKGHGLDEKTIDAVIKTEVSKLYFNQYIYHKLNIDGKINGREFEGKINLKDENAAFDFEGLVNLNPDHENYKFHFNLLGADLQKLNFTKKNIRIGFTASADLNGKTLKEISGRIGVTKIIIANDGKKYFLDSLLIASIYETKKRELNISSSLIGLKYTGAVSLFDLPKELNSFVNNYFPFSDSIQLKTKSNLQKFNFEIQLHNHPLLSEVFFPQLKEFEPGLIQGGYDSEKDGFKLNVKMGKIVYGTTELKDVEIIVNSDSNALNYRLFSNKISNSQIKFDNFLIFGKLADQTIFTNISSIDEAKNKKLFFRSQITLNKGNYRLVFDSKDFYLMNHRWGIAADNYIDFGQKGFLIHHFFINKAESQINISSLHNQFNDDLNVTFKNFKLNDISGIIEKDSNFISGVLEGDILLKRVNNTYGITADAKISNIFIHKVPIGNIVIKADNSSEEKFDIDFKLLGAENNLTAKGYYFPDGGDHSINIKLALASLSLKTVEAFSMGSITTASGNLSGNFLIEGKTTAPDLTGDLLFDNAIITLAALNNPLLLKRESIHFKEDGLHFNSFTLLDINNHSAILDGSLQMKAFSDFVFNLQLNSKDFLLFNTTAKDNKEFYGRMIIDSKINISGPISLPNVDAKLKMKQGSSFTFAVPESKLSTDKGEDVVGFDDSTEFNSILTKGVENEKQKSVIKGFDISSIIEIDKQATLRLLMDPSSSDSLVVKGEAGLSFTIDRSGKMSLTGAYNLNDGSYLVSLESVIKKRFVIESGSTIIWNGDPLDAEVSINAIYSIRTSPYDFLADQMTGLSEVEKGAYKQSYPFLVILKLRGEILHPQISFEIQLAPENKGILGGSVNTKLNMLNEDPSALNKQVFALLVLGRFIQENPLQSESNGYISTIRTTVGNFLSTQLNQLSSKIISGVELNFDIQSYDDYQTGEAQGRTQVEIGVKKQLFNERLSVQVGGTIDVEGKKASENNTSDIASDVTLEYRLTKDSRYRLKAFRHNQYEGAIDGQLVETGIGILYVRDFDKWKEFFKAPKDKSDSLKKVK